MTDKTKKLVDLQEAVNEGLASFNNADDDFSNVAQELNELRKVEQFLTFEQTRLCVDFLSANPNKLKELLPQLPNLCKQFQKSGSIKAKEIITSMVDRYVGQNFITDCDTLAYIGIQLKKTGYEDDALRCIKKAKQIISA